MSSVVGEWVGAFAFIGGPSTDDGTGLVCVVCHV